MMNLNFRNKKLDAAVALTTLIVIMAILLSAGTTLIMLNVDMSKSARDYLNTVQNDFDIESCLQESLLKLKHNPLYAGNETIMLSSIECNIEVTVNLENPDYRDVIVAIDDPEYPYKKGITVDTSSSSIKIVNTW